MIDVQTGQVMGDAVRGVVEVIRMILNVSMMVIMLRVLLSWVSPDPRNPLVAAIYRVTDPAFRLTRRWFPWLARGSVDLSPIVLILMIGLFSAIVLDTIAGYGNLLGNLMRGFGMIVNAVLFLFLLIFAIRAVMLIAGTSPYSPFYQAIYRLSAPFESRVAKLISPPNKPKSNGGNGSANVTYLRKPPESSSSGAKAAPWVLLVLSIILYGASSALIAHAAHMLNSLSMGI